jgi:putative transposase
MADTRRTTEARQRPETTHKEGAAAPPPAMPSAERVQQDLASATSLDDFFGKEGIFARLFATTIEQMLEAELTAHLGDEPYAAEGRNTGNSRNGKRTRSLRTSAGATTISVPRDRNGSFQSPLLENYQTSTNEREDKIIGLYAKGLSVRDIQSMLKDAYGVEVSPATISTVTDKVWGLVEAWQNRPLASVYRVCQVVCVNGVLYVVLRLRIIAFLHVFP